MNHEFLIVFRSGVINKKKNVKNLRISFTANNKNEGAFNL